MKIQDIRARAKEIGINSFGKTKAELIRAIQKAEGNFDCYGTATDYCDQLDCSFRSPCLGEDRKPRKASPKKTGGA
ncbi:MAG: hypothetical protein MUF52_16245 [Syntrophobacteraceae bacterium]|jgi:hypothetical protein|nr:hypothetical protein [Syntrophobacteraceae bacterium]